MITKSPVNCSEVDCDENAYIATMKLCVLYISLFFSYFEVITPITPFDDSPLIMLVRPFTRDFWGELIP